MTADAPAGALPRRGWLADWPLIVVLVALWVCLWGSVAPLTVLTGLVTAVVVTRIFELPALPVVHRLRPIAAAVLLVRLLVDVVIASLQVAALAVRAAVLRRPPATGLVRVRLAVRDDLLLTLTAVMVSLVPGSIVVEADAATATMTLHVLGARDAADVRRTRATVHGLERRIVRAFGSREQRAGLR